MLPYSCPSTFCYSPNLRYNYYRRLVAYAMLRHIDELPGDIIAWHKFLDLAMRENILRGGEFSNIFYIYWR